MLKTLGILIGGIFVGAVGIEIVKKKYPETMDKIYAKTHEVVSEIKEAFRNGYHNATKPAAA
jgi:hypothetical protein